MEEKIILKGVFGTPNVKGRGNFKTMSGFEFYTDIPSTIEPGKLYRVFFALRPVPIMLFNRPAFSYLPGQIIGFEPVKP